jgi:hypothetical protein
VKFRDVGAAQRTLLDDRDVLLGGNHLREGQFCRRVVVVWSAVVS